MTAVVTREAVADVGLAAGDTVGVLVNGDRGPAREGRTVPAVPR